MRSFRRTCSLLLFACVVAGCSNTYNGSTGPVNTAGSFSAVVDGSGWSPTADQSGQREDVTTTYANEQLQIVAYRQPSTNDQTIIELDLDGITESGQYDIGNTYSRAIFVDETLSSADQLYSTNANYTGTVEIDRFDTLLREVSGSFSFEAENQAGNFVSVRSGSFDLYY